MKNMIIRWILCLSLVFTSSVAMCQEGAAIEDDILKDTIGDAMIVGSCAAGGALLGLSTLSFVDEPKDHLKNVIVGLAIGTIVGVGVVAYKQANKSKEYYEQSVGLRSLAPNPQFTTMQRALWHQRKIQAKRQKFDALTALGYSFQF